MDGLAVTVLLRHELPDGSGHYDWLLECPGREGLIAFRVWERIDLPACGGCGGFEATRIADHRRAYLTYEGPVSGGRGEVRRMARGACEVEEGPGFMRVRADFDGRARTYEGRVVDGDRWRFQAS